MGYDLLQPRLAFVQLLKHDSKLVNEIGAAFGTSRFCVVRRRRKTGTQQLLRYVAAFLGSWKHLGDASGSGSKAN